MPFDAISYVLAKKKLDFANITNRKSSLIEFDSSIIPTTDNTMDLGSSTNRWKNLYIAGRIGGSLIPSTDNTYDLGSSSSKWRTVYANRVSVNDFGLISTPYTTTVQDVTIGSSLHLTAFADYYNVLFYSTLMKIEKWDGSTQSWVDVTSDPNYQKYGYWFKGYYSITIPNGSTEHLRFTFNVGAWSHGFVLVLIGHLSNNEILVTAERSLNNTTWVSLATDTKIGITSYYYHILIHSPLYDYPYYRLTLKWNWKTSNSMNVYGIKLLSPKYDALQRKYETHYWTADTNEIVFRNNFARLIPQSDNAMDLGSSTKRWKDLYIAGKIGGNLIPSVDNSYNLGSSTLRWANVYAVNVITGDLCFEEKTCEVCGKPFEKNDELVLKVKEVNNHTVTVPIHLKCSDSFKDLEERIRKLEEVTGNG